MINFGGDAKLAYLSSSKQTQGDAGPVLEVLSSGFSITWFSERKPRLWLAVLKPTPHIADYFALDLEYLLIGHGFESDFHQRTLLAEAPTELAHRIDGRVRFVASAAGNMRAACAAWAVQHKIAIVPIDTAHQLDSQDATASLYELLSQSLWRRDIFDDSEPVTDPGEFFGRELIVQELVARAYLGQPSAIFGLRKVGKTSLLRRVRDLLEAEPSSMAPTAFVQCNATRIKSGRWYVVLNDLLAGWAESINRKAAASGLKTEARFEKTRALLQAGRPAPSDAQVADAFERDFQKILKAAHSVATAISSSRVRLVAFFDEADELYPQRADAKYWKDDYFELWNTLQTVRRGLDAPSELLFVLGAVNPSGVEAGALLDRPNPLFELSTIYLQPLDADESKSLLSGLGSRVGMAFEDAAFGEAFRITGGHPWLLRKLGSYVHRADPTAQSRRIINAATVQRIFERSKRSFYQHVEWILHHLRSVAPDEYRLLKDIAEGGKDRYLNEWADVTFRDTFAEHLSQYGVVRFDGELPVISIGLVADALRQPSPTEFSDQKARLRDAADSLETSIRARLQSDISRERPPNEAVDFVVDSVPKGADNRPLAREALRQLGKTAGIRALLEALNWGDYQLLLAKAESQVCWSGPDIDGAERAALLSRAIEAIHLARHNNDTALRQLVANRGFGEITRDLTKVLDMLSSV